MKETKRLAAILVAALALVSSPAAGAAAQDEMMKKGEMKKEKMAGGEDEMMKMVDGPLVAIVRADWCPACRALEPTMKELMEQYEGKLNFVVLDVTNDETKAAAVETAKKHGLEKFFDENKSKTSTVAVFGNDMKVLFKATKNTDRAAYVKAFDDAVAKHGMMMKKSG
jgi:thiol-disulfide isomerase/thioredoxin